MSIFDEAKKMAEQALEKSTGMHIDLDGSDKPVVTDAGAGETTDDTVQASAADTPPANTAIRDEILGTVKHVGIEMAEQKLHMDLDGNGTIGT